MLPAFRSKHALLDFSLLLLVLLCLPLILASIGHPSREQAYNGMSPESGALGAHIEELFHDPQGADILFLGSSLVRSDVDLDEVRRGLSDHLGHPATVKALCMNWQGLDLQYFLLRDYLSTHDAKLVIWNMPVPGSRNIIPHVQAFHFIRFGEDSDALAGLSPRYRLTLYGDMVLGSPRELLSMVRPNQMGEEELRQKISPQRKGYYGEPFVELPVDAPNLSLSQTLEQAPWPRVRAVGPPLRPYEQHFAKKIVQLLHDKGVALAFLHVPLDGERRSEVLPERGDWLKVLGTTAPMIGPDSADLFAKVSDRDFFSYYSDQHMNSNGAAIYTRSTLAAILRCYDEEVLHDSRER